MGSDGFGDNVRQQRSLVAAISTAAIAAFSGAALRRWRLRQSASARLAEAEIATGGPPESLAAEVRTKRGIERGVVIGSFRDESDALRAMRKIGRDWPQGFEAYSPELNERFLEAADLPKSPTRYWILAGAIFGQFGGWALTIMLSIYWPHKVGNMPVIAVPPFTILSFELMVLMAVIAGVCGLLYHAGMPTFDASPECMRRFRRDRIGIAMNCEGEPQFRRAEAMLRELGAEDILRA